MSKKKTTRRRSIGKGHMQKKKSIEYQLQRAEVIGYLKAKKERLTMTYQVTSK